MYDYMKALQERFDEKQLEHLVYAVQSAREAKLMSFMAGFKLAAGIAGELGAPYSFDTDEEQKAKEMITNG